MLALYSFVSLVNVTCRNTGHVVVDVWSLVLAQNVTVLDDVALRINACCGRGAPTFMDFHTRAIHMDDTVCKATIQAYSVPV